MVTHKVQRIPCVALREPKDLFKFQESAEQQSPKREWPAQQRPCHGPHLNWLVVE